MMSCITTYVTMSPCDALMVSCSFWWESHMHASLCWSRSPWLRLCLSVCPYSPYFQGVTNCNPQGAFCDIYISWYAPGTTVFHSMKGGWEHPLWCLCSEWGYPLIIPGTCTWIPAKRAWHHQDIMWWCWASYGDVPVMWGILDDDWWARMCK